MFGMMPWGSVVEAPSYGLLLHFDGNLTDSSEANTVVSIATGTPAYTLSPAQFNQSIYWSTAPGYLTTGTIVGMNKDNGFMIEGWSYFNGGGGEAVIFEAQSGGTPRVGVMVNPGGNNMRVRYDVASIYSTTEPTNNVWHHIVLCTYKSGASYYTRVAVGGVWQGLNTSGSVTASDMTLKFAQNPGSTPTRHYYDEFLLTLGSTNFPYTPGTNFTPPTSPFSV